MTASEFTQAVEVWTGALVAASAVVVPAFMVISKRVADAKAYFQSLHAQNSARLDEHDKLQGVVTTPTGTVNAVPGQPPYPVTVLSPKVS